MKGTIQSNLGEGRYEVAVDASNDLITTEVARLSQEYDAAQAEATALLETVATLESAYQSALWAVYTAQEGYQDCLHSTSYDALLEAEEEACDDAKDEAYAKCSEGGAPLGQIMICRAGADRAYQACLSRAPQKAGAAWEAHQKGCLDAHHGAIETAQKRTTDLIASLQAARAAVARARARALAAAMRRTELNAIEARAISYTVWSAQKVEDLAADDPVEIATTPAGRHVVTALVAQTNCFVDARALPAKHLMVNAAIVPGVETWAPTWRTGSVLGPGEESGTLQVQFDPGIYIGSLGTDQSRREINCTPPQAYFDGDWQAAEQALVDALAAVDAARQGAAEARQALTDAIDAAAATRDASVASGDQNCETLWSGWLQDCLQVGPPAECMESYETSLNLCKQEVRDGADLIYQAAVATAHTQHDPLITAADEVVTEALAALHLARSNLRGPADPLILDCPVAHCEPGTYEVGDTVLIDFPARALTAANPLAVWDSRRVIGWADNPRTCGPSCLLHHGLEVLDLAALIADPANTRSLVYPGSGLVSYYAGGGWTIPDLDPARVTHFVGAAKRSGDTVNWPREEPTQSTTIDPPTLTDGAHEGLHGAGAAALDYLATANTQGGGYNHTAPASRWTGLARAYWQACRGAGMSDADVLQRMPADWVIDPGTFGMAYDAASKTYWTLNVSITGMKAHRMVPGELGAVIKDWLDNGDITGAAADLARAYVLADLYPSGETITLLTAEDTAPAYSGHGETVAETHNVLVEDAWPAGVTVTVPYGSSYSFVSSPTPQSGAACLKVSTGYNPPAVWFESTTTLATAPSLGSFYVWVYMPSSASFTELLLQFYTGSRRICAYFGDDTLNQYTHSMLTNRVRIGNLPSTRNAWTKLEIPAASLGLENETIRGVAFWAYANNPSYTLYWDKLTVYTPGESWAEGDAGPLQRGWVWDATGAAAAIVTHRTYNPGLVSQGGESALSTVAIAWADGVPSATIAVGMWDRSRPYWTSHKFWFGEPDDLALLRHGQIWAGNSDCAASAPIVCWYEGSTLRVWRYFKAVVSSGGDEMIGTTNQNMPTCGDYAYYRTSSGTWTRITGGYGLVEPTPMISGSGAYTEKTLTRTAGAWDDGYTGGSDWNARAQNWDIIIGLQNSSANACACGVCYPNPETWDWGGTPKKAKWYRQSAAGTLVVDSATATNATGGQIAVYLVDSPESIWSVGGVKFGRKQSSGKKTWQKTINYAGRMDLVDYYTGATLSSSVLWSKAIMYVCYYGDSPHCLGQLNYTQGAAYDLSNVWEGSSVARIGGVEYQAGDWGDWDHLDANGLEGPYQIGVTAMLSADGAAVYVTHQGADPQVTVGVASAAVDDSDGHNRVRQWVGAI